jgi:hypothetical protein
MMRSPPVSPLPALSYPFAWQVSPFAAEVDEACYPGPGEYTRMRRHGGTTAQPRARYAPDGTSHQAVIVFFSQMARDPYLRVCHDACLREDVGLG